MVATAGNWASLLKPGLKSIFDTVTGRPAPMLDTLFDVTDSDKSQEEYTGVGARRLPPVFTGVVQYDDIDQYYNTAIRNYTFADGSQIERQLVEDDQYNTAKARVANLATAFNMASEHDAAQIFINGFTDSGTNRMGASTNGADAVGLLSTAHPYSPRVTGTTQSNEGTLALNLANLDTTIQNMQNWTDDKGQLMSVNPDILLVPPELKRTAVQIVGDRAVWEPGSAQFDVNMFAGQLRLLVWNRLTDANAWFVIDSALAKQFLKFQWRIRPEFSMEDDFDLLVSKFRGYMRYGMGWIHWGFILGQNPS